QSDRSAGVSTTVILKRCHHPRGAGKGCGLGKHMAAVKEEGAVPDFLRMDQPVGSDPANARKAGNWHGWPTKDITPVILTDDEGRTVRIRTPVMDLEGLITPTDLHYTVQPFAV